MELCHLLLNDSLTPGWWYQDPAQEAPCLVSEGDGERGSQKTVRGCPSPDGQESPEADLSALAPVGSLHICASFLNGIPYAVG